MSTAAITQQFDDRIFGEPDSTDSLSMRQQALERFGKLGLPNRKIETWHYTDLSSLADKGFHFVAPAPDKATLERAGQVLSSLVIGDDRARCVFIDGHLIDSLTELPADVELKVNASSLSGVFDRDQTALASLNAAFANAGVTIRLNGTLPEPVEFVFIGTGQKLAPQVRLAIELAAGAKASINQHFADLPGADESWLNLVTDIALNDNSELTLYRLQTHESAQYQTTLNRVRLGAGAKISAGNVELGGRLVRNEFEIALDGAEADARIFGMSLTNERQHSDMRISVDHRARHTTSRQDYRAIVADSSKAVFNGKVIVRKDAQHIEARQRNDNLLLSSKAEVDTKPELEIYADQVICSHGATVGELSEEHLFYLRTRGIDEQTARGILTTAFANTIVERFEQDDFRERVRAAVHARLPRRIETG
jgi:Fe-S cluster assembly protein SufD